MLVYHKADIIISQNVTRSYHYIIAYHDFNYHFHLYSRYCWNLSWRYTFIRLQKNSSWRPQRDTAYLWLIFYRFVEFLFLCSHLHVICHDVLPIVCLSLHPSIPFWFPLAKRFEIFIQCYQPQYTCQVSVINFILIPFMIPHLCPIIDKCQNCGFSALTSASIVQMLWNVSFFSKYGFDHKAQFLLLAI